MSLPLHEDLKPSDIMSKTIHSFRSDKFSADGYQIEAGAAWDYMTDKPALKELAGQFDAVCFGSLAQRSTVSRDTIRSFLQNAPQAIRLYDVNLRRNTLTGEAGHSPEIVEYSCQAATIIPFA
jgi:fructokinase